MNTDFRSELVSSSRNDGAHRSVILIFSGGVWLSPVQPCPFVFIRGFLSFWLRVQNEEPSFQSTQRDRRKEGRLRPVASGREATALESREEEIMELNLGLKPQI